MNIPKNISKEHIDKALNEIENSKIPTERLSINYFLIYQNKHFPPKYVISIANKYANGKELPSNEFNAVQAKNLLLKLGYKIISKSESKIDSNNLILQQKEHEIINLKEDFKNYIEGKNKKGSNKASSYFQAIKLLNDILTRKSKSYLQGFYSIWEIESDKTIEKIYDYVLLEQKRGQLGEGGIFIDEEPSSYWKSGFYSAALKNYKEFLVTRLIGIPIEPEKIIRSRTKFTFKFDEFSGSLYESGLFFSEILQKRFVTSLLTKPFVILSGLSGSGKTKLAQAFVYWICTNENQYKIVPVGADWTNREPLLGYPNALDQMQYIKPDNGVVDLMIHARDNQNIPHFLILDEMNLSHVERYFADFLSAMESGGKISFHSGKNPKDGIPPSIIIPDNLFIIGTINVDETTYMFSPKVLDRANVIEFRISNTEMEKFLKNPLKPNLKELTGKGYGMAESFMELARKLDLNNASVNSINEKLIEFFTELKKTGAEFGYRSAYEIHRLINQLSVIDPGLNEDEKLDIAIMQKLLPKLHGSRRKLCPVLQTLGEFCVMSGKFKDIEKEIFMKEDFDYTQESVKFPLSLEKLSRMFNSAVDNGFASYAEA